MAQHWEVEYTDEFGQWWNCLSEGAQESIDVLVRLLERLGPQLGFPHTSGLKGARLTHLRELRVQHQGRPLRVLYAFDPRRTAILLLGGDKTGDDRWYREQIPVADRLYQAHLETLIKEGLIDGRKIQ
ncbi:MAG: addiction module toxin RelE [Curvibacter sp.]|nr:MAG: addiction module toxin RelE [Curvibacter sp.]